MRIAVVTLFPELVKGAAGYGVTGRALGNGTWTLDCINPRDFARDRHRTIDDRPYGGGPGMVMMPEPLEAAIEAARQGVAGALDASAPRVVYLSPQGVPVVHERVVGWAALPGLVLVAGRYEGIDERVLERCVDEEASIGDFVVSGGELPALLVIDAVVRQLPGVLNDEQSCVEESFVAGLLDCPHYTRPERYRDVAVPGVLLSGHHLDIARWRLKQSLGRTWLKRPDLLARRRLTQEEARLLDEFRLEQEAGE